jgi:hypothetical protein
VENRVSTENWAEERERLAKLLDGIDAGNITHVDQAGTDQLWPTSEKNIAALRERLAELKSRLGEC